jgi:glycosyltransferase involved in cell wall biosynthesis
MRQESYMTKVAYIYGRHGPHPFHRRLGEAVDAEFVRVDFRLPWHGRETWRPYRYLNWATCALSFPRRSDFDVFLTDGPQIPPLILKQLGLLRKDQRVAALMANEMLYFLKVGRYSKRSTRAILYALNRFDAIICLGAYQTELAHELLGAHPRPPQILTGQEGIFDKVSTKLQVMTPRLDGHHLLFIGNCHGDWGTFYKGVDLLLDTFALAALHLPELTLDIVGHWDQDTQDLLRRRLGTTGNRVRFLGQLSDLSSPLSMSSLYVHLARGDASPISVVEAMLAGLAALVSDQTGRRDGVARVDSRLVVPLDAAIAADRIRWYLGLDRSEKLRLSERSRHVAAVYSEANAVALFRSMIDRVSCA